MKRRIWVGLVLSATLVVLGLTPGLAQGPEDDYADRRLAGASPTAAADAPWFIDTVVQGDGEDVDVGRHVSLALDPRGGWPFISYYNEALGGCLYLARYVGPSNGACGPNHDWNCQILDSLGSVGQYNAIATYPSGNGVRIFISYYDFTWGALKLVEGYAEDSAFSWSTHTIDEGNPGHGTYKGLHTSVKVDSTGVPHIAYQYYGTSSAEAQLYAYWVGDGTGNCGEGSVAGDWQCDVVYNDDEVGMYASLDLDGDDEPHIAFYDADNGCPWVASYIGSGGNCGPTNDWYCRRVHQPTLDTGQYASLYVEDNGQPHLAYHNVTSGTLEYAQWVGSGGNCGFSSASLKWEWQCDEIDDMGTSLTAMGVATAEDGAGYPIIAYQDASGPRAPAALRLARPHAALDPNTVPNCGPEDLFLTWYCALIDGGGSSLDEASSVSLAVNSAGLATIAYHELNSYPYPVEGNLKLAYQRLPVFLPLVLKGW
jgi:hypothetical protein